MKIVEKKEQTNGGNSPNGIIRESRTIDGLCMFDCYRAERAFCEHCHCERCQRNLTQNKMKNDQRFSGKGYRPYVHMRSPQHQIFMTSLADLSLKL